jgi:hypothetical protein
VAVEEPDAAVARVFHRPLVMSLVLASASSGYWTAFAPASREARRMATSLPLARGCDGPFHADCHIRASVVAVRSCSGLPCSRSMAVCTMARSCRVSPSTPWAAHASWTASRHPVPAGEGSPWA